MSADGWLGGDWLRDGMAQWRARFPWLPAPPGTDSPQFPEFASVAASATITDLIEVIRSRLVGREFELDVGSSHLWLRLDDVVVEPPRLGPMMGQYGTVRIMAGALRWNDIAIDRVVVTAQNVHIHPSDPPVLVAAPVDVVATITQTAVDSIVAASAAERHIRLELAGDTARVRSKGHPALGHLEVTVKPEDDHLEVAPLSAVARDRWRLARGLSLVPRLRIPLPAALQAGVIRSVSVVDGEVVARGQLPQWRRQFGARDAQELLGRLRSFVGARLVLPGRRAS
jgi:hypothetical protein